MVGVCSLEVNSEEVSESVWRAVGDVMTLRSYSSSASESAYPVPVGNDMMVVAIYAELWAVSLPTRHEPCTMTMLILQRSPSLPSNLSVYGVSRRQRADLRVRVEVGGEEEAEA